MRRRRIWEKKHVLKVYEVFWYAVPALGME